MTPRNPLLQAALHYASAEIGRPVFPVEPRGKRPIIKGGLRAATRNADRIERWWSAHPEANVGLLCGGGVLVLDVDGPQGAASLARLEKEHGPLPRTIEAITGRGRHLYFMIDRTIRSTAGRIGLGLDTRADGGYVLAPPSVHPSGHVYRWRRGHGPTSDLAELPAWMDGLLPAVPVRGGQAGAPGHGTGTAGRRPPDHSASGADWHLALKLLRQGATDEQVEDAIRRRTKREEGYVGFTVRNARIAHEESTPRATIQRATLQRLPARFGKPELTRLALELHTVDGEIVAAKLIIPSSGYPQAAETFAAVLPDADPRLLAAPWREACAYFLTLHLRGRALEVASREGVVKWMRVAAPAAIERRTGT